MQALVCEHNVQRLIPRLDGAVINGDGALQAVQVGGIHLPGLPQAADLVLQVVAFDIQGLDVLLRQPVLLLFLQPQLLHGVELGAFLGGRQHEHLDHKHEHIENNLADVEKIIEKQVVVRDDLAFKIENRGQDAHQRKQQQGVLHGDLTAAQPPHFSAHSKKDKQIYHGKTAHIEQHMGDGILHKIGPQGIAQPAQGGNDQKQPIRHVPRHKAGAEIKDRIP